MGGACMGQQMLVVKVCGVRWGSGMLHAIAPSSVVQLMMWLAILWQKDCKASSLRPSVRKLWECKSVSKCSDNLMFASWSFLRRHKCRSHTKKIMNFIKSIESMWQQECVGDIGDFNPNSNGKCKQFLKTLFRKWCQDVNTGVNKNQSDATTSFVEKDF